MFFLKFVQYSSPLVLQKMRFQAWLGMQARVDWVLIIFETQVIKKKWLVRPMFPDYFSVSYEYSLNFRVLSIVLKNQQQLNNSCIDKNNESILEEIYLFHDRPRNLTIPNNHQRLSRVFLRSLAKKTGHGVNVLIKVLRLFNTWVLIKCGNIFGS